MWPSYEVESFAALLSLRASGVLEELVEILVNASNDAYGGGFNRILANEKNLAVKIAVALRESHYDPDCGCLTAYAHSAFPKLPSPTPKTGFSIM